MKLQKLEIVGFKSFADKEDFVFESGITAIVGPNGCGKSNVMDAMKWILGEQSAKSLRGKEMSDVIFGGSSARSSVGLAEASLTISNEEGILPVEYKEVVITRRLYASGESEYLINKNACRLKDIREVFLGTGVGVNSYSIIEQGKVEALLQANANERRAVFEEAAGISKFKAKKRETLVKLEKTQHNLLRINDIVREVERQLRSIKIQATKAKKFKEYCERLRELKLNLSLKNYRDLMTNESDISSKISQISKESEEVLSVIDSMDVEVLDFESQLSAIDQKASETTAEIISIEAKIANAKDRINFNNEKITDLEQQGHNYSEDLKVIREKITENRDRLINTKKALDDMNESTGSVSENLVSREEKFKEVVMEASILSESIEEKKSAMMDIYHAQSKTQNELGNQETIKETLVNRKSRIETTLTDISVQIDASAKNLHDLKALYTNHASELKNKADKQFGLKGLLADLAEKNGQCDEQISIHENIRSRKQSRLEVLEDYELRSEGVDSGVKAILTEAANKKDEFSGIRGLVADTLKVDLPYACAIETALGELTQSIIANSYEDSINAINFLKKSDSGNATFLLLDKINDYQLSVGNTNELENADQEEPKQLDSSIEKIYSAIIGKASYLVTYDKEFKSVFDYLLDKTLVVEDFTKASFVISSIYQDNSAAKLIRSKYGTINRIVTLDGALIETSGVIKGGSAREKSGLILRKSEIDSIRAELIVIEEKVKTLHEEKKLSMEKLNNTRDSLDLVTGEIEKLKIVILNNENEKKQEDLKCEKLNEERDVTSSELIEIEQNMQSIDKREEELKEEGNRLASQHQELEHEINIISEEMVELEELKASVQEEITEIKITIAQNSEKKEALLQAVRHSELNDKELNGQLNARSSGIDDCKDRKINAVAELEELNGSIDSINEKKNETEELLSRFSEDRERIFNLLGEKKTEAGEHKTNQQMLEKQLNELRLKENEYQVRTSDLEDRIFEEYKINLSDLDSKESIQEDDSLDNEDYADNDENRSMEATPDTVDQLGKASQNGEMVGSETMTLIENNDTDWNAVKAEVEELTEKIRKIGSVNVEAIQELEESEARFEFLTKEREDLGKSEKILHDIIEKLNHSSRELFEETFNNIKEHFYTFFRKLFGGGRANIVLEEGVDILDAGIEIIIQPPNKEFKSIALFSGGEKVMITVALLFAILKSKPTPFCLMDEVDAALDESNIGRFTSVLTEFAQNTQFIIISHNKKTMQIADVIYGVTMEEPGVSKKVAVRFDNYE